jgi:hypothetical protein
MRVRIRHAALLALAALLPPGGSFVPLFTLEGKAADDGFGSALATGDVDGDGAADIAVGAPGADGGAGAVYIYSGRTQKLLRELHGAPGERFGQSVALTFLQTDSMSDLIVGAPGWKDGAGAVYLAVRPSKDDPVAPVRVAEGERPGDQLGWSVAAVPAVPGADVTGILAGEPGHDEAGHDDAGRAVLLRVKDPKAGKLKVEVVRQWVGECQGAQLGAWVSRAGDVNSDATLDSFLGEPGGLDTVGQATGALRVVDGANGKQLLRLAGRNEGDAFGSCAASVVVQPGSVDENEVLVGAKGYAQIFASKDGALRKSFEADATGHDFGLVVGGSFRIQSAYKFAFTIATPCLPDDSAQGAFHGVRVYSGQTLEEIARIPAEGGRLGLALEHATFKDQANEALIVGAWRPEHGGVRVEEFRPGK